jgi:hypothetical protein
MDINLAQLDHVTEVVDEGSYFYLVQVETDMGTDMGNLRRERE